MAEQFFFVEALEEGCWRNHKQMIMALVEARWCIDGVGVEVLDRVVYSFADEASANYFLTAHESERYGTPRAVPVLVKVGDIVAFWKQEDADYFVAAKRARPVSNEEIAALMQQSAAAQAAPEPAAEPEVVAAVEPALGAPAAPKKAGKKKAE